MKKQLVAVAIASAFAGSAFAANVDVYGVVDTGLVYSNTSFSGDVANKDTNKFSMDSGVLAGSRFGLKGTEDLGDGYSVDFKLENGFSSDTGTLGQSGRLFGREARLSLNTPYGTVSFGRIGALTSGMGSYDIFQSTGDALDGGNAAYIGTGYWFTRDRYDNMVTLVTPEANGFTGYAQYSFRQDGSEKSSVRDNPRYAALGVTKAFFGAQYGKNEAIDFSSFVDEDGDDFGEGYFKGYNLHIGAATPLPCGTITVSAYYGDYENVDDNDVTAKKYGIGVMHEYSLSKRTTFYTGAGFAQTELKEDGEGSARLKGVNVTFGLNHKF